jgi:Fe-S-cluster containining protein
MNTPDLPSSWDLGDLEKKWLSHLESMIADKKTTLPLKRVRFQAEGEPTYSDITSRWPEMTAEERSDGWKSLIETAEKSIQEVLPTCVQCGECCRNSSPTLHLDDLDILREEKIPWNTLVTIRQGEPARNPHSGKPFFLPTDYIKVREKEGSRECVFLDAEADTCTLYGNRPLQCRAQACWDSSQLDELIDEPRLTRKDLFANVKPLIQLIEEHDRRCSFEKMRQMFDELKETKGKNIDAILDLLAFDEHVRQFAGEKMTIPENVLDLVFGKKLSDRVSLFGFKVEIAEDGTRTLLPQ